MREPLIETPPSLSLEPVLTALPAVLLAATVALGGAGCDKQGGDERGGAGDRAPAAGKATRGKGEASRGKALVDDPHQAAKKWLSSAAASMKADSKAAARYALQSPPKVFDKDNVFDLLNGGADQLIEQGLRTVLYVRVHDTAKQAADFEIQIWDVSTAAKARSMLAREKAPKAEKLPLGDAAWAEPGAVLLVKGRHLVRVTAQPAGDRAAAPVREVARKILATPGARW